MITVTDARFAEGYSSADHMLDAGGMSEIIGRQFGSVDAAAKAAREAAGPQDVRCSGVPIWITTQTGHRFKVW